MKEIKDMLIEQWGKMIEDGSMLIGGIAGAVSIALPQWITESGKWSSYHTVLILILVGVIAADWTVGSRLAKKSTVKDKGSDPAIDSVIRDFIILGVCAGCYGLDYLFGTGSVIFVVMCAAFIYHNFYSVMANIVVLGWGKHFPLWLIHWLDNEIKLKVKKYFPDADVENELEKLEKGDEPHGNN